MENYFLHIESYLLGELNETDLEEFEIELQKNGELALAVDQMKQTQERLSALRVRNKVKSIVKNQVVDSKPGLKVPTLIIIITLIGIVSTIWIMKRKQNISANLEIQNVPSAKTDSIADTIHAELPIIIDTIAQDDHDVAMNDKNDKALSASYYVGLNESQLRGFENPTAQKTMVQQAIDLFVQKKYIQAIMLLKDENKYVTDETAIFIRAHCYYKLGQYTSAALDFKRLSNSFQYKNEARWNLLVCNIAQGKKLDDSSSASLLNSMIQDKDYPFHDRAVALRRKL